MEARTILLFVGTIIASRFGREIPISIAGSLTAVKFFLFHVFFLFRKVIPSQTSLEGAIRRVVWIGDDRLLSGGFDGEITEWDLSSLTVKRSSSSFGGSIWDMSLNKDQTILACACEDGSMRLFDVSQDDLVYMKNISCGKSRLLCLQFSKAESHMVAVGDVKGRLQVYDVKTGAEKIRVRVGGSKVESPIWSVCYMENDIVVTGDSIGYTQFFDVKFGTLLHSFYTHKSHILAITAHGNEVYSSGMDSKVTRFEKLSDGTFVPTRDARGHLHDVLSLDISAQHSTLISSSVDGTLRLYGLKTFGTRAPKVMYPFPSFSRHVVSVAPKARILCCRLRHSLQLWKLGKSNHDPKAEKLLQSGAKLEISKPHLPLVEIKPDSELPIFCCDISKNGELVLCANREGIKGFAVEVGNSSTTVSAVELPMRMSTIFAIKICLSEKYVTVVDNENIIITFDLSDLSILLSKITFHAPKSISLVSVKDDLILSLDEDNIISIHKVNGDLVCSLQKFEIPITSVSFHPTQSCILIASLCDRIYIYDYNKKEHNKWSLNIGDKLDTRLGNNRDTRSPVLGFAFGKSKLIFWENQSFNVVDIEDAKNEKIEQITRYKDMIFVGNLNEKELVIVERDWQKVLQELPPPLQRHRYV